MVVMSVGASWPRLAVREARERVRCLRSDPMASSIWLTRRLLSSSRFLSPPSMSSSARIVPSFCRPTASSLRIFSL